MRASFRDRAHYIKPGAVKVQHKTVDAVVYLYSQDDARRRPCAVGFSGKRNVPDFAISFTTDAQRERHVRDYFAAHVARMLQKEKEREARRPVEGAWKVGDILVSSWGYDQTNVDFYEITEARGKTVWLRRIAADSVDKGNMSGTVTPRPGDFLPRAEVLRRLAQPGHVRVDRDRHAHRWEGRPEYFSSYH